MDLEIAYLSSLEGVLLVLSGLALAALGVSALLQRRRGVLASAGFRRIATPDEDVLALAERFLGPRVAAAFSKRGRHPTWLVTAKGSGNDDPDTAMLVYPADFACGSEVALFRTTVRVPLLSRKATGGAFARLDPMGDGEYAHLCGPGWFAFKEPRSELSAPLFERLCSATQLRQEGALSGIALYDRYLAVWADAANLHKLVAAGAKVRAKVLGG